MATVFVYGSLKRGFHNHRCLTGARFTGAATIDGWTMFDLGAFPAIVPGDGKVHGEVYECDADVMERLDCLEGFPILYNRKQVMMSNGQRGWVYYMDRPKAVRRARGRVEGGCWGEQG